MPKTLNDARLTQILTRIKSEQDKLSDEVASIKSGIERITGIAIITLTHGSFIKTDTSPVNLTPNPNATFNAGGYALIPCSAGDKFTISGTGAISGRLWCFVKSDNTIIAHAGQNITAVEHHLTAPQDSAYLIINSKTNTVSYKGDLS